MAKNCYSCSKDRNGCGGCLPNFNNWTPKEKDMEMIQIGEEQLRDMLFYRHESGDGCDVEMTILNWKEQGYVKEELLPCPWCGREVREVKGFLGKYSCSNTTCWIYSHGLTKEQWQKRA